MAPGNQSESSGSIGQSAIDDPMSPYFLHHSDNPGLVLVSQSLTGDNYSSWSRSMKIALSVKNKFGFVDGTIAKPSEVDSNLLSFWTRNNNIVISWILNSVSKEISASVLFSESAANIWDDLQERYQQSNGPRIFQLRRDLINLRQEQQSVSVYFTKLEALWEELNNFRPLCSCGRCICEGVKKMDTHYQMDYIMTFLMGLNDSFAQIRRSSLQQDTVNHISVETWHSRLGHPSIRVMDTLKDRLQYNTHSLDRYKPCLVCPLAKQRRLAFIAHNNMSASSFDLIHCDVWGPYHVPTQNNQRYFLTLVDDCTRFTWVFLLQHKSDAYKFVSKFCVMVETQFLKRIKAFRTDNAKELAFTELFLDKGIVHQFSCVQTPQQNSVVERKHQHLLNVARALLFQSRVPDKLRESVFGCLAFASTLAAHRDKLSPRARACVFLGYPPGIKGYKLLDITRQEIFVSRDVIFHEDTFPFLSITPTVNIDPFPSMVLPLPLNPPNIDTAIPTSVEVPHLPDLPLIKSFTKEPSTSK
ncbi:uncharacterized protein [Primulina eburnea]|uniref:uncharacterized protein n=1 Tax=Primulina eburnea TaxID=1245227 RepID=UPI003C6BF347